MEHRCMGCMHVTSQPVCEKCGFPANGRNEPHQLPVGSVLRGQYTVGKVLGQGGFGITYIGWDNYLDVTVAIKEYYPNTLVKRDCTRTTAVTCYTQQAVSQFQSSRERFLREAKALARFENVPAIVKVKSFFPENNTAYIVMEYVKGVNLAKFIRLRGGRLTLPETLRILKPVMTALDAVHKENMVHRDISPDNVILHPVEGAKLLDFGAVRSVENADADKAMHQPTEAILKHGFAPMEQYQSRGSLGPWTDVYAMCATVYYCLTGRVPLDAPDRAVSGKDAGWDQVPGLSGAQREVLRKGMAMRASDRYATMGQLCAALEQAEGAPAGAAPGPAGQPDPLPGSGIRRPSGIVTPAGQSQIHPSGISNSRITPSGNPAGPISGTVPNSGIQPTPQALEVSQRYAGVVPGIVVRHKAFGDGTVTALENGLITVSFAQREQKFQFPGSFIQGFLTKL